MRTISKKQAQMSKSSSASPRSSADMVELQLNSYYKDYFDVKGYQLSYEMSKDRREVTLSMKAKNLCGDPEKKKETKVKRASAIETVESWLKEISA